MGLETVLVSDVGNGVDLAIRGGVGELSTDGYGRVLRASVLKYSLLLGRDTVASFISTKEIFSLGSRYNNIVIDNKTIDKLVFGKVRHTQFETTDYFFR